MDHLVPLFAYFTPETLLPVGSILATVAGVAMMLGRGSLSFLFRCFRRVARPSNWIAGVSRPHFRTGTHVEPQSASSDSRPQSVESPRPQ
jgi:hypothetical protein